MKLLKKIDKNLERWVMFVLLAGMTLVLGIQIFCRFVLNNSLTWSEELARFMFIWSTFLSIGFCLKEGISLKIDTLISLFPKKVQAVILLLGDVVMTVFFLYLLPSAWEFAYASVENRPDQRRLRDTYVFCPGLPDGGLCAGRIPGGSGGMEQPAHPASERR